MKKASRIKFVVWFLAIVLLSGCSGLSKMQKRSSELKYSASPEILEMHADDVALEIKGNFPAKYFSKKATITVQPVLKYGTKEKNLKSITLQGENVEANNVVINFEEGGGFTIKDNFPYSDEMKKSELELRISASVKSKSIELPAIKIADGIIATPKLLKADAQPIVGEDKFKRIIPESQQADIHYLIQQSGLRNSELRAEDVKLLKTYIKESNTKENFKFTGVELSSYASPDGELDLNEKLSQRRDKSAIKFLKKELRRSKVEGYKDDKFYTSKTTAEDWKGFEKLMQASDIQDKQLVLRVLQMYSDPIVREKEIKNMAKVYTELADEILPKLRRSKLTVNIDVIGLTNEELIDKATRVPDTLTNEELLFAANLADDNKTKLAIYESTASSFPKDWRAMNNIGVIYVEQNNIEGAKKAFENAKRANENSTVLNNLGVIELLMGNFDEAETYFKAGMGAGQEVNHNLGIVNIKKGDYSSAISKFGKEASFNVVLAKILSKDYSGALSTIEKIKNKDAMTFYLKAIIGARQDNKDLAMNSLRSAISQDPTLSGQAKTDLEFFKYFEDDTFKGIVK